MVGGTVRDAFLDRQGDDLDLAVAGGAMALARRIADALRGAYVPLDAERDVARVVLKEDGRRQHLDFAGLRSVGIEADLRARDFTVNAMAVPISDLMGKLLDPTGGQRDMHDQVLRATSGRAFLDDPLRIIRGVRLRGSLGFRLDAETEWLARAAMPGLSQVSPERIRDELLRILALTASAESLRYAGRLGIWGHVLPQVSDSAHLSVGADVVEALETGLSEAKSILSPHDTGLADFLDEELSAERPRRLMVKLAALLSKVEAATVVAQEVGSELRLSTRQARFLGSALLGASLPLWEASGDLGPLDIHRFYRLTRDAGVASALVRPATSASCCPRASTGDVDIISQRAAGLIRAWFERHEQVVDPPRLVSGDDLMRELAVERGPIIGRLLDQLREAQVQGLVSTPEQALAYLAGAMDAPGQSSGASSPETDSVSDATPPA